MPAAPTLVLAAVLTLPFAGPARAQGAPDAGCREILEAVRETPGLGFSGGIAQVRMELRRPDGEVRRRTVEVRSTREDGRLRALVRFLSPSEVAGTALLVREREDGPDEQVLWLPALKRTRRIGGEARRGAFMGTDFSYADLEVRSDAAAPCRRLPDAEVEGRPTRVVEVRETEPDAPYGRVRLWVDVQTGVPLRMEMTGRDGKPEKVLRVHRLQRAGRGWMAAESTMEDVRAGSSTRLEILSFDPDAALPPEAFTERALEQG